MSDNAIDQAVIDYSEGRVVDAVREWLDRFAKDRSAPCERYLRHAASVVPELVDQLADEKALVIPSAWFAKSDFTPPPPPPPLDDAPEAADEAEASTDSSNAAPTKAPAMESIFDFEGASAKASEREAQRRAHEIQQLEARLQQKLHEADYQGALDASRRLLAVSPGHEFALEARGIATAGLERGYSDHLGDLNAVPRVLLSQPEVTRADLDERTRFVLRYVDGRSSFSEIAAASGMERYETLGYLSHLYGEKIIGVG